jgi:hypothetical protein
VPTFKQIVEVWSVTVWRTVVHIYREGFGPDRVEHIPLPSGKFPLFHGIIGELFFGAYPEVLGVAVKFQGIALRGCYKQVASGALDEATPKPFAVSFPSRRFRFCHVLGEFSPFNPWLLARPLQFDVADHAVSVG